MAPFLHGRTQFSELCLRGPGVCEVLGGGSDEARDFFFFHEKNGLFWKAIGEAVGVCWKVEESSPDR